MPQTGLPNSAFQLNPGQQHGKGDVILVQHATSNSIESHLSQRKMRKIHDMTETEVFKNTLKQAMPLLYLEEILCDKGKTLGMVCNSLQIRVLVQDVVIDIQEKLKGILVQEVYLEGRFPRNTWSKRQKKS